MGDINGVMLQLYMHRCSNIIVEYVISKRGNCGLDVKAVLVTTGAQVRPRLKGPSPAPQSLAQTQQNLVRNKSFSPRCHLAMAQDRQARISFTLPSHMHRLNTHIPRPNHDISWLFHVKVICLAAGSRPACRPTTAHNSPTTGASRVAAIKVQALQHNI